MLQRIRRRFAQVVLSLMVFHAAALGASSLSQPAPGPTTSPQTCRCCCSGGARMLTCPMARAQSGGACRLRCGATPQPVLVFGLAGMPVPSFVASVRLASEELSIRAQPGYSDIILSVPALPPRETTSHS